MHKLIRNFILFGILFILALALCLLIRHQPPVKVLTYHAILSQNSNVDYPAIEKDSFIRQIDFLSKQGYQSSFLSTAIKMYVDGKVIPAKWLVLTFDEPYEDFYHIVYPVLKKYKFRATIFVFAAGIGHGYLTWEQLHEMKNSGLVEIGSHSMNHIPLTCLSLPEAKKEITMSKTILEEKLQLPITTFCYPNGAVNTKVAELVKEAGYVGAVGIVYRWGEFKANDIYNLNRIYISKFSKYPFVFRFMLSGYYVPVRALMLKLFNIKAPRDAGDCSQWEEYKTEQFS